MSDKSPTSARPMEKQIPHAGKILALIGLLVVLAVVFIQGVLVGLHKIYPWDNIKTLFFSTAELSSIESNALSVPEPVNASRTHIIRAKPALPVILYSNLLNSDITWINPDQPLQGLGGGLSLYQNGILAVHQRQPNVWYFDYISDDFYQTSLTLPPNNADKIPARTVDGRKIFPGRYNNVHVYRDHQGEHLLAIYGYYDPINNCRTLRLSTTKLAENWRLKPALEAGSETSWQLLFEAKPCLSFMSETEAVTGFQEGGALLQVSEDEILFSTGDMGHDGVGLRKPILSQGANSDYGSVFSLSLSSKEISRVANGLRNPQNLVLDDANRVWSTEQGPMGGDELNLIITGKNYGWPYVTYGADYTDTKEDYRHWLHLEELGRHDLYEQPKFTWTPSVAPSSITYITDYHPRWNGGLLVSTLSAGSIMRLTLDDGQVIGQERLQFKSRIRDVLSAHGRIYFLSDKGLIGYLSPRVALNQDDQPPGQTSGALAKAGCFHCHTNPTQPSLARVYGADIASQAGITYSAGLSNKPGVWTEEKLRRFITNPDQFASGSIMPKPEIEGQELDQIISELRLLNKPLSQAELPD
ncbi:MAG: PQQ-dependent sugar dehydrogenase [Pseudomonadales bacterium]|nr:PQQ-dependent sugar dehydrogenase [Pseudomonadales bacterium]